MDGLDVVQIPFKYTQFRLNLDSDAELVWFCGAYQENVFRVGVEVVCNLVVEVSTAAQNGQGVLRIIDRMTWFGEIEVKKLLPY